ncbi:arsenic resistance N-acetyltransferase ArsN2 [Halobacterium zhouii]|uniref:arsenic resistance N-acetyltransferase ArsN2 n=1 Tax=Halobacterium zhouii TaxID=2902624 RepID=UPI001E4F9BD1|nr:arsenic resistance N-acetyltransferase ArsN2 [Halobacterium zhouii]
MTADVPTVRAAEPEDHDRVVALLNANDLPHRDLQPNEASLLVAVDGGDVVGAGALEPRASSALLRSLVVADSVRGRGYGTALCDALEGHARENGVDELYLLTTSAAGFFRTRGYEAVDRERAPRELRQTSQFTDVCPSTATCMRKPLRE